MVRARSPIGLLLTLLVLLLGGVALAGCAPAGGAGQGPGTPVAPPFPTPVRTGGVPTAAPPALTADPTRAAQAALTVIPPPTDIPGLPATQVARATAAPYPTAHPSTVQIGSPAVAVGQRGAISIELRLAGDTYLAGENGRAQITIRNNGDESLFAGNIELAVQDERGTPLDPWPLLPGPRGGWPGQDRFESFQRSLGPGESISQTLTFQMPAAAANRESGYTAQATARFSRPDLQHPDRSDNVPIAVGTGAIPLRIIASQPAQHLQVAWQADRHGYSLRVTGGDGQPVAGPLWGAVEVVGGRGMMAGPLADSAAGTWAAPWDSYLVQDSSPLMVSAWVAAHGYVAATLADTIAGSETRAPAASDSPLPPAPVATATPAPLPRLGGAIDHEPTARQIPVRPARAP